MNFQTRRLKKKNRDLCYSKSNEWKKSGLNRLTQYLILNKDIFDNVLKYLKFHVILKLPEPENPTEDDIKEFNEPSIVLPVPTENFSLNTHISSVPGFLFNGIVDVDSQNDRRVDDEMEIDELTEDTKVAIIKFILPFSKDLANVARCCRAFYLSITRNWSFNNVFSCGRNGKQCKTKFGCKANHASPVDYIRNCPNIFNYGLVNYQEKDKSIFGILCIRCFSKKFSNKKFNSFTISCSNSDFSKYFKSSSLETCKNTSFNRHENSLHENSKENNKFKQLKLFHFTDTEIEIQFGAFYYRINQKKWIKLRKLFVERFGVTVANESVNSIKIHRATSAVTNKGVNFIYCHTDAQNDIAYCLSLETQDFLLKGSRESEFYGVSNDASTSSMGDSIDSIHIKFVNSSNIPCIVFIGLEDSNINFSEGEWVVSALDTSKKIFVRLRDEQLDPENITNFGADGTSKNSGIEHGIAAEMNRQTTKLKIDFTYDPNHNNSIAVGIKENVMQERLKRVLECVSQLFTSKLSSKKKKALIDTCKIVRKRKFVSVFDKKDMNSSFLSLKEFEECKFLRFKRTENMTRHWNGLYAALNILIRMRIPLVVTFQKIFSDVNIKIKSRTKTKMRLVEKEIKDYSFFHYACFIHDFISIKMIVDQKLQKKFLCQDDINSSITYFIEKSKLILTEKLCDVNNIDKDHESVMIGCENSVFRDFIMKMTPQEGNMTDEFYVKNGELIKSFGITNNKKEFRLKNEELFKLIVEECVKSLNERFKENKGFLSLFHSNSLLCCFSGNFTEKKKKMKEDFESIVDLINSKSKIIEFGVAEDEFNKFFEKLVELGMKSFFEKYRKCENSFDYQLYIQKLLGICDENRYNVLKRVIIYTASRMYSSVQDERLFSIHKRKLEGRERILHFNIENELKLICYEKSFTSFTSALEHLIKSGILKRSICRFLGMKKRKLGTLLKVDLELEKIFELYQKKVVLKKEN